MTIPEDFFSYQVKHLALMFIDAEPILSVVKQVSYKFNKIP